MQMNKHSNRTYRVIIQPQGITSTDLISIKQSRLNEQQLLKESCYADSELP